MKTLGNIMAVALVAIAALTIPAFSETATITSDPAITSAPTAGPGNDTQLQLQGSWSGTWKSEKGHNGQYGVVIQTDSEKKLVGSFYESGTLITKWKTAGRPDGEKFIFESPDRIDTLWLEKEELVGTYAWKNNDSRGTMRLKKK